jgi:hypothetical protein
VKSDKDDDKSNRQRRRTQNRTDVPLHVESAVWPAKNCACMHGSALKTPPYEEDTTMLSRSPRIAMNISNVEDVISTDDTGTLITGTVDASGMAGVEQPRWRRMYCWFGPHLLLAKKGKKNEMSV